MNLGELLLIALGLSMDAFAVAICKGLAMPRITRRDMLIVGLWFGGFQALMPLLGYALGGRFQARIVAVDHWIAFGLLLIIGGKMIWEALRSGEEEADPSLAFRAMLVLAVATSIDALAIGVTFAFLGVRIVPAAASIGLITLALSMAGVRVGHVFGARYKAKAELAGGVILVLLGTKILLEHLGIIGA